MTNNEAVNKAKHLIAGKLTSEQIEELKKKFARTRIYRWSGTHDEVYFKVISQEIALEIQELASQLDDGMHMRSMVKDKIWDSCVLWPGVTPEVRQMIPAGVYDSIVKHIEEKSGYALFTITGEMIGPSFSVHTVSEKGGNDKPSEQAIEKAKKATTLPVSLVKIEDYHFLARPITVSDSELIKNTEGGLEAKKLAMVQMATLYPEGFDWGAFPAGLFQIYQKNVLDNLSGYNSDEITVEEV